MRYAFISLAFVIAQTVRADDRELAAAWKAAGNNVKVEKDGKLTEITFAKSETLTDDDFRKLTQLDSLKQLTFYGTSTMTDAQAEQLGRIGSIEKMAINGTALSDAAFKHLANLKKLKRLTFWHLGWQKVPITGKGFEDLAGCPDLEAFGFSGSTVGNEGLKALSAVKSLREIEANHTRITDEGLGYLKTLPHLTKVHVGPQFSMRLGDAGLAILASIPTLETISYGETVLTYEGSLKDLKSLKSLQKLTFDKVEISDADFAQLKNDLPTVAITHTPPDQKMLEQMHKIQPQRVSPKR